MNNEVQSDEVPSERLEAMVTVRMTKSERVRLHSQAMEAGVSVQRLARQRLGLADNGGYAYGKGRGKETAGPSSRAQPAVPRGGTDEVGLPEVPVDGTEQVLSPHSN